MGIDIRLPLGALFSLLGLILIVYGAVSDATRYQQSLGININLDDASACPAQRPLIALAGSQIMSEWRLSLSVFGHAAAGIPFQLRISSSAS